jgi:hypothetical protein
MHEVVDWWWTKDMQCTMPTKPIMHDTDISAASCCMTQCFLSAVQSCLLLGNPPKTFASPPLQTSPLQEVPGAVCLQAKQQCIALTMHMITPFAYDFVLFNFFFRKLFCLIFNTQPIVLFA